MNEQQLYIMQRIERQGGEWGFVSVTQSLVSKFKLSSSLDAHATMSWLVVEGYISFAIKSPDAFDKRVMDKLDALHLRNREDPQGEGYFLTTKGKDFLKQRFAALVKRVTVFPVGAEINP